MILNGEEQISVYYINPYVAQTRTGSGTYLQELFESLMSAHVISQLLKQARMGSPRGLTCPFCGLDPDPRLSRCNWDKRNGVGRLFLDRLSKKRWPHAKDWENYLGKTEPILEDFITTSVPGEDDLAALRADCLPLAA